MDRGQSDQGQSDAEPDSKLEKDPMKQSPDVLRKALSSVEADQSESGKQNKIELFEQEYEKYVVIKDLLRAPSQDHHIQRKIYNFKYARKKTDKNIQRLEDNIQLVQSALEPDPPSATETQIDQAIDNCDTLRGLAPEVMADKLMNRRRTPTVIAFAVFFIAALFLIFRICGGPRVGIVTDAKFVVAVMTAILSIGTFTVGLEKDVISSLNNDQQDSIMSSTKYLSRLLNYRTVNAISIIVLLVAAVIALV